MSTDRHACCDDRQQVTASGVATGPCQRQRQLGWLTLGALTDSSGGMTGSQTWTFSAPDHYFDYLADSEAVTLTYTVQVDDHHGGVDVAGRRRHRDRRQ